ncbi:hypothetical protein IQ06DRAFT_289217 [Phaeosphaeriaceae sp. SRC1lsM3a]|nr:hypothetical protein IQ06DRAFT_289217 [Stagonospora sp. SRC1lsM3a]
MATIYRTRISSGRMFRLLFLYPSLDSSRQLECYCCPFELDAAPPYEALSYVWGQRDSSTDVKIHCNGEITAIGFQLAGALKILRLAMTTRIIWTDANCINQNDNEGKSYQVPLMGSIYSCAKRVLVWLGHGDLRQIGETAKCVRLVATACRQHSHESEDRYSNVALPDHLFNPAVCAGLKELYDRPWFSRIWCVQEIRLARAALVIWDKFELEWDDVGLTASWIFDQLRGENLDTRKIFAGVLAENADLMYDAFSREAPLLETLRSHREWESTDPRDLVYGLLSLVTPQIEAEAMRPDYNKAPADVFADTVLVMIQLYSQLTTLAYVSHPEGYNGDEGYRSWAPRWDRPDIAEALGVPEESCPWNACAGRSLEISIPPASGPSPARLCLPGIFHDAVASVEEEMDSTSLENPKDNTETGIHPFLSAAAKYMTQQPSPELSREQEIDFWCTFARTLSAGTIGLSYIKKDTDWVRQESHLKSCTRLMKSLLQKEAQGATQTSIVASGTERTFKTDSYFYCHQRRFFWTDNGTFGLGPQYMSPGDVVVVLYGGNTPYVLRPRGGVYLFLGQAYVDNIMQGELMEELRDGRRGEQEFCLI